MPSLRSLALLTAALSATAYAANTVTVLNRCGYAVELIEERDDNIGNPYPTSALDVGAMSSAYEYNETPLHLLVNTVTNSKVVEFEVYSTDGYVYYDVVEDVSGSDVGSWFVLTTSSVDCPDIDGATANITPTDANSIEACASGASFTWALCG